MGPQIRFITAEICQVGGPGQTDQNDAAIYLVHFADAAALIDAGSGRASDRVLMNIAAAEVLPEQVQYLLLTHCHYDHTGGAADLRRRLGCRVFAHALDAPYIEAGDNAVSAADWYGASLTPCAVDRKLTGDGGTIALGARAIDAIHIPGHSPGSLAYLVQSQGHNLVFAQDVHGPLHPELLSDAADYRRSLQRLLDLDADILCEGHYGVFTGRAAVAGFIRRFLD